MNILGISAFYHDSAACLVRDGVIIAAAEEERFSRRKHDAAFPERAVDFCLAEGGITRDEIDHVAFYDKPFLKFERILESYLQFAPRGLLSFNKAIPPWIRQKLWTGSLIKKKLGFKEKVLFLEHHESHAASAFFPSPFQRAAFLTVDGVGEWTTTSLGVGVDNRIRISTKIHFPHSIGLLYSAFTHFLGFKVNSDEYKVMGLAPYGEPRYRDLILRELIHLKEDGSFRLNLKYFDYCVGLQMTNARFSKLFGGPPRQPGDPITQRENDIARSIQEVTEKAMLRMVRHVHKVTGEKNICLAGGVALNCVANGKILRDGLFENIWIQPAAGDAGGALGSALFVWYQHLGNARKTEPGRDLMRGAYLGPSYQDEEIGGYLKTTGFPFRHLSEEELPNIVSDLIANQKVVGWFQGRMEFGPRALGNRSILGDPRSPTMQKTMNLKIKLRESFRPFAPAVLQDKVAEYFELDGESPYMLLVAPVRKAHRPSLPAVTHVDTSARIQTVNGEFNPRFHAVISRFGQRYGYPIVINTSFNVNNEPIVRTPEEAYRCFQKTDMDCLVMGRYLLEKNA